MSYVNTGWTVGVVKSVETKKSVAASLRSSVGEKSIAGSKNQLNREDYGVNKYRVRK